jgi:hypothetical protein
MYDIFDRDDTSKEDNNKTRGTGVIGDRGLFGMVWGGRGDEEQLD